jgi:fused signal recognition particle receptor
MVKWFKRKKTQEDVSPEVELSTPETEEHLITEITADQEDIVEAEKVPAELPVETSPLLAENTPELSTPATEVILPSEETAGTKEDLEAGQQESEPAKKGFFRRWRTRRKTDEEVIAAEEEVEAALAASPSLVDQPEPRVETPVIKSALPQPVQPEAMAETSVIKSALPQPVPLEPDSEVPAPEPEDIPHLFQMAEAEAEVESEADIEADIASGEPEKKKRGLFHRLRFRLSRTRSALASRLDRLFLGKKEIDEELLEELEELLITADMGVETSLALIETIQEKVKRRELTDPARLKSYLKDEMIALLTPPSPTPEISAHPRVIMLIGVNGVGKTTTLAKLAYNAQESGQKVLLVAADTFRAAAIEQLEAWGRQIGVSVIKQKTGSDPAAVVFDGIAAGRAREVDIVFIDTAGRLHTKINLMEELKKIKRTADRQFPGAPHEIYLVLDATTGQNAISQAKMFHEALGITGLIITKLDGTAKGGVALGVVKETGLPLRFIGVGEQMTDLRPFEAEAFVEAILG